MASAGKPCEGSGESLSSSRGEAAKQYLGYCDLLEFRDIPPIERLLDVESLEDEGRVVALLTESSKAFWQSKSHMFCNLTYSTDVYRFLYGFIYDSNHELHAFVTTELLAPCSACILGYLRCRKRLLLSLGVAYDASSVKSLDREFLKWDSKRVLSGLQCSTAIARAEAFQNALFELLLDGPRLLLREDSTELVKIMDTISQADKLSVVTSAVRTLVQAQPGVVPTAVAAACASGHYRMRTFARYLLDHCHDTLLSDVFFSDSAVISRLLGCWVAEAELCLRDNLKGDSLAMKLQTSPQALSRLRVLARAIEAIFSKIRVPIPLEFSSSFQRLFKCFFAVLRAAAVSSPLTSAVLHDAGAILSMFGGVVSKVDKSCFLGAGNSSSEYLRVLQTYALGLALDASVHVLAFHALKELLLALSNVPDLRDEISLCAELRDALKAISQGLTSKTSVDVSDVSDATAQKIRSLRHRLLLLVLAVDSAVITPTTPPVTLDASARRTSLCDEPLIVSHKLRFLPFLTQQLQSPKSYNADSDRERCLFLACEKLMDWAVIDLKFELIFLHTIALNYCSSATPERYVDSVCPRSGPILGLLPMYVKRYYAHPTYCDNLTCQVLRNVVDVLSLAPLSPGLVDEVTLRASSAKGETDETKRFGSIRDALVRCQRSLDILVKVGTFCVYNVIDRLRAFLGTSDAGNQQPPSEKPLPPVESLLLPNRTSDIGDVLSWSVDLTSASKELSQVCRLRFGFLSSHSTIAVMLRFVCVFLSGQFPPVLYRPFRVLVSALLPKSAAPPTEHVRFPTYTIMTTSSGIPVSKAVPDDEMELYEELSGSFAKSDTQQLRWLLESVDVATEVLMEKSEQQQAVTLAVREFSSRTSRSTSVLVESPLLLWHRWFGMMISVFPGLDELTKKLLQTPLSTPPEAELLADVFSDGWKAIALLLASGPLRTTAFSEADSKIVHADDLSNLFFDFLSVWMGSSHRFLESVARQQQEDVQHNPIVQVHISAFVGHSMWTGDLVRWCEAAQSTFARLWSASRAPDAAVDLQQAAVDWRATHLARTAQSVCASVARAMTVVYKNFHRQLDKGPPELPLIARGELVSSVGNMLRTKDKPSDVAPAFELDVDALDSPRQESLAETVIEVDGHTAVKSATDTASSVPKSLGLLKGSSLAEKEYTLSSNTSASVASQNTEGTRHVVDIESGEKKLPISNSASREAASSKVPTSASLSWTSLQTSKIVGTGRSTSQPPLLSSGFMKRRTFDFMTSMRRSKPSVGLRGQRKGIPLTLAKKVGEPTLPHIKVKLPSKLPAPPHATAKPYKSGESSGAEESTSTVKTSKMSLIAPTARGALLPKATPILAAPPQFKRHEGQRTMHVNDGETALADLTQVDYQVDKARALTDAKLGVEEILTEILKWNIFNLDSVVIQGLQELSGHLPLVFENEGDFRTVFHPLVLEECRCSLAQGGSERKLEGLPVMVVGTTRMSSNLIATVCSSLRADGTEMTASAREEGTSTAPQVPLQLQAWDLVMLVPREAPKIEDGVRGRTLSEMVDPPPPGYLLAIAEKEVKPQGKGLKQNNWELRMPFQHCQRLMQHLRRIPAHRVSINSTWTAYVVGSLTTSVREFQSLFMSTFCPLFPFILNPKDPKHQRRPSQHDNVLRRQLSSLLPSIRNACQLNESQSAALVHALTEERGVALLQGPPGTGKTKTLLALLATVLHLGSRNSRKPRILVCAPSNAAVDEIAARVLTEGLPNVDGSAGVFHPTCIRVGNPSRITRAEVLEISLSDKVRKEGKETEQAKKTEYVMKKDELERRIEAVEKQIADVSALREAQRFTSEFDDSSSGSSTAGDSTAETTRRLPELYRNKRLLHEQRIRMREQLNKDVANAGASRRDAHLTSCDIVFATLSGSATEHLSALIPFSYVIIDEAAQAVELSTLIPLRWEPQRLILIGDPQQLPATVLSKIARQLAYERSLFERLQRCGVEVKMLLMQYRMRREISAFPAAHFYRHRLLNSPCVKSRPPLPCHSWTMLFAPFLFFDVPSEENRHVVSQSLSNREEAAFIVGLLEVFVKHFVRNTSGAALKAPGSNLPSIDLKDIAVVTPYKHQVIELRQRFDRNPEYFPNHTPEVCTVDAFQGREKRIIVFSCVRSDPLVAKKMGETQSLSSEEDDDDDAEAGHREDAALSPSRGESPMVDQRATLGFVADVRRMNVAITRARDCLWVVGSAATLKKNPSWRAMIRHAKRTNKTNEATKPHALAQTSAGAAHSTLGADETQKDIAFVNVRRQALELRRALRPQISQRSEPPFRSPASLLSDFMQLSEELYVKQHAPPASPQRARQRTFSNCSSITSSCSSGDELTSPKEQQRHDASPSRHSSDAKCVVAGKHSGLNDYGAQATSMTPVLKQFPKKPETPAHVQQQSLQPLVILGRSKRERETKSAALLAAAHNLKKACSGVPAPTRPTPALQYEYPGASAPWYNNATLPPPPAQRGPPLLLHQPPGPRHITPPRAATFASSCIMVPPPAQLQSPSVFPPPGTSGPAAHSQNPVILRRPPPGQPYTSVPPLIVSTPSSVAGRPWCPPPPPLPSVSPQQYLRGPRHSHYPHPL